MLNDMQQFLTRSSVFVDGEKVGYSTYKIDARDDTRRLKNKLENKLEGNLIVYLPGHVQPVDAARELHTAIVQASRAGVLWSVDIDPPKGGDPVKAAALIQILRREALGNLFENPILAQEHFKVTVTGWSHGGAEALRVAELAPDTVECVIALCTAGLDMLPTPRLIGRLPREIARVTRESYRKRFATLRPSLRFGLQLTRGFAADLVHTRSPMRLVSDLRWVGKKVVGPQYGYKGSVVIILSEHDAFFHWRELFPNCARVEDVGEHLEHYYQRNFPNVRGIDLRVLPGSHLSPELHAAEYLQNAQEALDQMGMVL
jgi:pimeloyl-ACP methyl ester carboxylesterase